MAALGGAVLLRIVNRAAVALLAGGVLHVLQLLLLIFELGFHDFHLLLFLLLALVPLHAVCYTIARSEMDGIVEPIDVASQSGNCVLQRQNLSFPLVGGKLRSAGVGLAARMRLRLIAGARVLGHRNNVRRNFVVRYDLGCLRFRSSFGLSTLCLGVFGWRIFLFLLPLLTCLPRGVAQGGRILAVGNNCKNGRAEK